MWITLDQVHSLKAVHETGSLNSAAEKLNKAKSAVSYSIRKLEEQLGFRVFERGKYRLNLTRKGLDFLDRSENLLNEANQLKSFAEQLRSGVELNLELSSTELFPLSEFNTVLGQALKTFPHTQILYQREILSGEKLLHDGRVDLAMFETDRLNPLFEQKRVKDVELKLVISSKHSFVNQHKSDQKMSNLFSFPQIVQRSTIPNPESKGVHSQALKWFVSDTHTKKQIILDGLGWGRLPDHEVDVEIKKGRLTHLKHLKGDDRASIYLSRLRSANHGKVNQFIWDCF